jgi:hypothetical protein
MHDVEDSNARRGALDYDEAWEDSSEEHGKVHH